MEEKFKTFFLKDAIEFLYSLDVKTRTKIIYNIDKSKITNDSELFKKLVNTNIWEFRTSYNGSYYRLFAFWDKTLSENTLVVSTHGIIKKTDKTPKSEIDKAEAMRTEYFLNK